MPSDIVFDTVGGDSISLEAARVILSGTISLQGRVNLQRVDGATPPADGEWGDLVMTVEESGSRAMRRATARLWLCVPPEIGRSLGSTWREVQLGDAVAGG